MKQIPKTVISCNTILSSGQVNRTVNDGHYFFPQRTKPEKQGIFTQFLQFNTATTENEQNIKSSKMKSLNVSINGHVTTMFVDKGDFYSAINMEQWEIRRPKLNSLPKEIKIRILQAPESNTLQRFFSIHTFN